jgi:PPIC-type PPIASE domain
VNRRPPAVLAIACALIAASVSSCATFDRNDVAAKVGSRSLTSNEVEQLALVDKTVPTGDQLREQLTKWVRVTVLESSLGTVAPATPATSAELDTRLTQAIATIGAPTAQSAYETGVSGSPLLCLGAITLATIGEANTVLASLTSGTSFSDAARQFSTDTGTKESGGIAKDPNGKECVDNSPSSINPDILTALKDTPVGQPIVAELGTFSAVLMLRPFAELLPASQLQIASANVPQEQLDALVDDAKIYIDPRYGRWDAGTGSVVTLTT